MTNFDLQLKLQSSFSQGDVWDRLTESACTQLFRNDFKMWYTNVLLTAKQNLQVDEYFKSIIGKETLQKKLWLPKLILSLRNAITERLLQYILRFLMQCQWIPFHALWPRTTTRVQLLQALTYSTITWHITYLNSQPPITYSAGE